MGAGGGGGEARVEREGKVGGAKLTKPEKGNSSDRVAAATGFGHTTLAKAREIVRGGGAGPHAGTLGRRDGRYRQSGFGAPEAARGDA